MNRSTDTRTRERDRRRSPTEAEPTSHRDGRRRFTDEEWLTPIQIARKLGYATDKPIRNAIKAGKLKASHAPCRRKLIVAESELLRWIDHDLAYEPMTALEPPPSSATSLDGRIRRRHRMPTLDYDARRGEPE